MGKGSDRDWRVAVSLVKVNRKPRHLWRVVDHEGKVQESFVTKEIDKAAALRFSNKALKRHGRSKAILTDDLASYGAALKAMNSKSWQAPVRRWQNNRAENGHPPFRRHERAMNQFRRMRTLQDFVSVHASVHNHSTQERHLVSRDL